MIMNRPYIAIIALFILLLTLVQCKYEERFYEGSDINLRFSLDTLHFDTVFTSIGSATRFFKVYNDEDLPIKLDVQLESFSNSKFRLNIDGSPGKSFEQIEIAALDSMYVFCEVTIDPDEPLSQSPFVIEEDILFTVNGKEQKILLEAWGQNANYFPNKFANNKVYRQVCNLQEIVWDDPKPYVVYGVMILDSCTLRLPPGTEIYIHGGIANNDFGIYRDGLIYVFPQGKIIAEGSAEEPVIFQSDRLEPEFQDEWGQWQGLRFAIGNKGSILEHTIIRNAINGIILDSLSSLKVKSSIINNCSNFGIFTYHANLQMENSLIYNTGSNALALTYGGDHRITYSTLANYNTSESALFFNNYVCRGDLCQSISVNDFYLIAKNNIIYGQGSDEINISEVEEAILDYHFETCIVKIEELLDPDDHPDFLSFCEGCIIADSGDTLFVNASELDFHLDSLSIAESKAVPIPNILLDLDGKERDITMPDIGCFEYEYK